VVDLDSADDADGPIASINIIPFVDIVLVLLVVFMLTSSTILRASLEVVLPKAASAGSRVERTVNLIYTREGELWLDGQRQASWQEAALRIRAAASEHGALQAALLADRGVEYGRIIELIDLVKQNGISTFALDVERTTTPGEGDPRGP
jgi:biopolymer transport protein ExbD